MRVCDAHVAIPRMMDFERCKNACEEGEDEVEVSGMDGAGATSVHISAPSGPALQKSDSDKGKEMQGT